MSTWIIIVIIAQFLAALSALGDKFLVSDHQLKNPTVYAFYVSILSGVVLFMLPSGVISMPSTDVVFLSIVIAFAYIFSIMGLYTSLRSASASEVLPIIGGVAAIATFLIKHLFYGELFTSNFVIGSFFLVIGMVLISHFRFPRRVIVYMFVSGILFAVSSILVKEEIFQHTDFYNGFFWTRMANVFGALLLLAIPGNVRLIFMGSKHSKSNTTFLVLGNKIVSAISFVLIFYALSLSSGNVSVINALSALQYLFIFIMAVVLAPKFHAFFKDEISKKEILHKLTAISIILIGFFVLFT
ncbi:MAG: hypothetical protein WC059_03930 [Candidatus Paceibacterota bacterium]